jgi:hypothetical protein
VSSGSTASCVDHIWADHMFCDRYVSIFCVKWLLFADYKGLYTNKYRTAPVQKKSGSLVKLESKDEFM